MPISSVTPNTHQPVSAVWADAGGDQIADASEARECRFFGSEEPAEAGHFDLPASHQSGLRVVAKTETIADTSRDGDDVFHGPGDFDSNDVEVGVHAETLGAEHALYLFGHRQVSAGGDHGGGETAGNFFGVAGATNRDHRSCAEDVVDDFTRSQVCFRLQSFDHANDRTHAA